MADLLEEFDDGIVWLTMNRPERLNALSRELVEALLAALERVAATPEARVVVLTGAGRAFCAGGDVKNMQGREDWTFEMRLAQLEQAHRLPLALHRLPRPTIALLNGPAMGAGLSLALACDFRVAGRSARLGAAFARVGLSGDYGGSWLMTRLAGTARTRELYFTGEIIDAGRAARDGLVNRVVEDAELRAEGRSLAQRLCRGPTLAFDYMKRNLSLAETGSLEEVLAAEAEHQARVAMSADHREGVRAFAEKRPPVFEGR